MLETLTPAEAEKDDGTPLETLVAWFEDAEEASEDARKASERSRDYYDGKQFTAAEIQKLRKRGQPDIVINRIAPKINYLLGWEAVNRTDPRAFPRTPQDEDAAEAATDALRYVGDANDINHLFSTVWEHMLVEGFGGIELTVEQGQNGDPRIVPVVWEWDRLFFDPHSRKHDFSDARYLGGVLWYDAEEVKRRWPEAAERIEYMVNEETFSTTYDDRPNKWVSRGGKGAGARARVRVVQMYHKEGPQWVSCIYTKGGKLESTPVPFTDKDGMSWCPLFLQSAFVDRQNNRYGIVHSMIGVQDEINKRRSKALHRLTMRQVRTEHGAVEDVDALKAELAKPDGVIVTNPGFNFEVMAAGEQLTAELDLLQEAKAEIELMGPNAAMQGKQDSAPSGRAILANQQGGQTEISLLLDRHRHMKRRVYRGIWDLIRQYKREEWWIRVTDDEKNVKFVGMNRPVTAAEELRGRLIKNGADEQQADAKLQELAADPNIAGQLQMTVRVANNATEMDMDITLEEVPDSANVQMEQFDMLTKLAPAVVFPPQVYIEASSLRNKKRLLEIMGQGQGQDPVAAEAAKIKLEQAIKKTEAEIEKLKADALKALVDADKADAEIGVIRAPQIVPPMGGQQNSGGMPPPMPAAGAPPGDGMPPPG